MFSNFLQAYEEDLKKYKREFIKIEAQAVSEGKLDDPLGLQQSKFLGRPFLPKNLPYPKDLAGNPTILLAQLNMAEIPPLANFPQSGLLQVFISPLYWYQMEAYIKFIPESQLKESPREDFSFLEKSHYQQSPVRKVHQLTFSTDSAYGGHSDSQFDYQFDGKYFWDFADTLGINRKKFISYFNASGHKMGGYAEFTQFDPRANKAERKNDIQLLQIDMDNHIMFGDSGVAHVFISPENLKTQNFEAAYFYWDCR